MKPRPIFTAAESKRQTKKLSDALNQAISEAFQPLSAAEKATCPHCGAPRPIPTAKPNQGGTKQ